MGNYTRTTGIKELNLIKLPLKFMKLQSDMLDYHWIDRAKKSVTKRAARLGTITLSSRKPIR